MKEIKKKLAIVLFGALLFLFAIPVMANDAAEKKEVGTPAQSVAHSIADQTAGMSANEVKGYFDFTNMARMASDSYYLTEVLPKPNAVLT